jgi:hypothetical protein
MLRAVVWLRYVALACGIVGVAWVLLIVIPAYDAIGPVPPPGVEFLWFPEIARGVELGRAGWLACASTGACLWAMAGLRRPSTHAERLALAVAIGGAAVNAAIWIRYGSRMMRALSWEIGSEGRAIVHWLR